MNYALWMKPNPRSGLPIRDIDGEPGTGTGDALNIHLRWSSYRFLPFASCDLFRCSLPVLA